MYFSILIHIQQNWLKNSFPDLLDTETVFPSLFLYGWPYHSASKIPTEVTLVKFDSVSDIYTESQVDHGNMQFSEFSNIEEPSPLSDREGTLSCDTVPSAKAEAIEPSELSPSPVQVRMSTRSTSGMPPTR